MLHHDSDTISEITRAVNAGKDVTTHTDAVSIPGGWSGFGYIITDPVLGDGVYKISGGSNGGVLEKIEEDSKASYSMLLAGISPTTIGENAEKFRYFKKFLDKLERFIGNVSATLDILKECEGSNSKLALKYVVSVAIVVIIASTISAAVLAACARLGPQAGVVCFLAIDTIILSELLDVANKQLEAVKESILEECRS